MKSIYFITDNEFNNTSKIQRYFFNNNIKIYGNSHSNNDFYLNNLQENVIQSIKNSSVVIVACNYITNNIAIEIGIAIGLGKKINIFTDNVKEYPNLIREMMLIDSNNLTEEILEKILYDIHSNYDQKIVQDSCSSFDKYLNDSDYIYKINAKVFENFVMELVNYTSLKLEKNMNKFGYDFSCSYDNEKMIMEVKKLSKNSKVSINYIQQFFGIMNAMKIEKGIFISNVDFTPTALDFASMLNNRIKLIRFDELFNEIYKNKNYSYITKF